MSELIRSLLFAPADKPDVATKLARSTADVVVLDLEDAIAPNAKAAARRAAAEAAATLRSRGVDCFVRINTPTSPWFDDDLQALSDMAGIGVVVPKIESPDTIEQIQDVLAGSDARIIAGVETAIGVARGPSLLSAPVIACYFGAEDYCADVGGRRTERGDEVLLARSMVVMSARIAGIAAIDQAVICFRDDERFRRDAEVGRDLGYVGKLCIHPTQVALANEVFGVTDEELAASRDIVQLYERASREGAGVIAFDGQMIDEPIVRRARAIVAQQRNVAAGGGDGGDGRPR